MLTTEQVKQIRAELTLGDAQAAKALTKDQEEIGLRAFHRRAQKLGFVNGEAFEDFLDLVRVEDIRAIASADVTGPLVPTPGVSLPSADTGG